MARAEKIMAWAKKGQIILLAGICQEISQIETEMQMKRRPTLLKGNFMSEAS